MCGITGFWRSGAVGGDPAGSIAEMTQALRHRGPDSSGSWLSDDRSLALGHARLAIVDLSEHGAQPMASRSGRHVMVFNGEIYNHLELRRSLPSADWRGQSDTETLLAAIAQWGLEGALQRAVGMFALALWDRAERRLSLARDRMGEKPLYYACGRHGLAFASELKSLWRCPGLSWAHDQEALRGFVRYGFIGGDRSAYLGVKQLAPGSILVFERADAEPAPATRYWQLPSPVADDGGLQPSPAADTERLDRLDALLQASVRQQMLADVPLGAFLSGGVDSTLIVALMQRNATQPVRTFTMGFDGGGDDELLHARETARVLGTRHTELRVEPADVLATIPRLAEIYDEPFADASQVPTVLLSRLTREHVTVALSGDGGDELFGGYNRYRVAAAVESMLGRWPASARRVAGRALLAAPARAVDALAAALRRRGLRQVPQALGEKLARLAQFMAAPTAPHAYLHALSQWTMAGGDDPLLLEPQLPRLAPHAAAAMAQRMMCWDMQGYLTDDILVKVDRAAMASSLETRVPLLDHRIVEFALATPMNQKIRGGRTKWLLRELLARQLPQAAPQGPKQGFTVPLADWLRGPLRPWADDLLAGRRLADCGLVDPARVQSLWREHLAGQRDHHRGLWTLLMLQAWLERSAASAAAAQRPAAPAPALATGAPALP